MTPHAPAVAPTPSAAPAAPGRQVSRRSRFITWGITGLLVAGTAVVVGLKVAQEPPPISVAPKALANVETLRVEAQEYREALVLPAKIVADRRVAIASELSGRVEKWLVAEGAPVAAGQVLAVLNADELQAQLAQAEAAGATATQTVAVGERQVEAARVGLEKAEKDTEALRLDVDSAQADLVLATKGHARVSALSVTDVATRSELERTENALSHAKVGLARAEDAVVRHAVTIAGARAALAEAEAVLAASRARVIESQRQVAALRVTLSKTEIRAPFAGQFDAYLMEAGEVVRPGDVLGRLYDLAFVRAEVDVPDRYAPLIDSGGPALATYLAYAMPGARQEVRARIRIPGLPKLTGGNYAGVEFEATVDRVAKAADTASNTFRVELRFENPAGALKEGIIAQADIEFLLYPAAVVVPLKSIQVTDAGPRVLIVEERDGRTVAASRAIEPASIREDRILVRRGLAPGEQLVVAGGKGVLDREEVRVLVADGQVCDGPAAPGQSFLSVRPADLKAPAVEAVPGSGGSTGTTGAPP